MLSVLLLLSMEGLLYFEDVGHLCCEIRLFGGREIERGVDRLACGGSYI